MFGLGKKKKEGAAETTQEAAAPAAVKTAEVKEKETDVIAGMKVKVTDKQPCLVTLSVQVPEERLDEAVEEAFHTIQAKVKMPGFRPGKVPMALVKKNFEGSAREEALDKTLRRTVFEVLQAQKIVAVATPMVDKIEFEPNKPLKFEMKVECAPEFTLKEHKGLALDKKVKTFSDADVEKKLDELREGNAKLVLSEDKEVSDKHFVIVDYTGTVDGKPLEGGEAKGQLIDMAAPQTIAGFTDGLRAAKVGETKDVTVTFPADYPKKDLAGKTALFKVAVTEIKEKRLPEANDDFAKDLGVENIAEVRDRIRKNMEAEFQRGVRQDLEKQLSEQLVERNSFDVPPSLVKEHTDYLNQRLKQYLLQQGASEEDWKSNESKMIEKNKVEAERQLRLSYILSSIAREEKIEATEAEVEDIIKKSVESVEPARRGGMEKYMESRRDSVHSQLIEEKVYSWLIDQAKVKEVPAIEGDPQPAKAV
jgi:trigger factor